MQKCLDFRATKGKNSVPLYLEETVMASESARPTPVVDDSKNNANPSQFRRLSKGKPRALNLNAKVATSPPPDPDQSNTGGNPPESWATPNTMDHLETRSDEGVKHIATGARKGRARPSNLREQIDPKTCEIYQQEQGSAWPTPRTQMVRDAKVNRHKCNLEEEVAHPSLKLSSRWVEALMGLPIGWTDPTCSRPITPWEAVYTAASMNSEPLETE